MRLGFCIQQSSWQAVLVARSGPILARVRGERNHLPVRPRESRDPVQQTEEFQASGPRFPLSRERTAKHGTEEGALHPRRAAALVEPGAIVQHLGALRL